MPATFCLTFDTELIWGSFDHTRPEAFERTYPRTRDVIDRTLRLLDAYEVPATWAVVGHLFLSKCARDPRSGLAHPELARPFDAAGHDWLAHDPCTDRHRDPLWYGDDVITRIREAQTPQEIGCHTFSHRPCDDPALADADVLADLRLCQELAAGGLRSFVFPRNREGHHGALLAAGFSAYRGPDAVWWRGLPRPLRRVANMVDHALALPPPVSQPDERLPGLWNVPGSMGMLDRRGIRRLITRRARMRKASAGLRRAVARGAVFHLWTHPFNFANDPDHLLGALEATLHEASTLRARGVLEIETMGSVAMRAASERVA